MAKYKNGDRVILKSNDPSIEDESGKVLDYEGDEMYIVEVDVMLDEADDRLREVHEDLMEPE